MISLLLALTAVVSDPTSRPDATATSAPAAATAPARPATDDTRRYCISENFTGSIITRKTCRTKAEWQRHGVTLRD